MNFASMTREQLINKLIQIEKKVIPSPKKVQKQFDFSKSVARHIALKVTYFGQDYFGFTGLPNDPLPTIEGEIFKALLTCKLIPKVDGCQWSRAGRTDKGVSGFGQVVSFWARTNLEKNI